MFKVPYLQLLGAAGRLDGVGEGLDQALAVLQTAVTLELVPGTVGGHVPSLRTSEDLQVLTVGHQHNLQTRKRDTEDGMRFSMESVQAQS